VDVGECVFSAKPDARNVSWPPEPPLGDNSERVADMYVQATEWVDLSNPAPTARIETNPGPDGLVQCRIVDDTKVKQRVLRLYCVKTFVRLHRKVSWKNVVAGVVIVGGIAGTAPFLLPVHLIAGAAVAAIAAGGGGASVAGGAVLTVLNPAKVRRDPRTEQLATYERLGDQVRDRPPSVGPWRTCRSADGTHHRECEQHD
jgi:hypothetical protein